MLDPVDDETESQDALVFNAILGVTVPMLDALAQLPLPFSASFGVVELDVTDATEPLIASRFVYAISVPHS